GVALGRGRGVVHRARRRHAAGGADRIPQAPLTCGWSSSKAFRARASPRPRSGWRWSARGRTWHDWSDERLGHWHALVAAAGPLTIMESAARQHPLLAMLRRDVAPDVVLAHVR